MKAWHQALVYSVIITERRITSITTKFAGEGSKVVRLKNAVPSRARRGIADGDPLGDFIVAEAGANALDICSGRYWHHAPTAYWGGCGWRKKRAYQTLVHGVRGGMKLSFRTPLTRPSNAPRLSSVTSPSPAWGGANALRRRLSLRAYLRAREETLRRSRLCIPDRKRWSENSKRPA